MKVKCFSETHKIVSYTCFFANVITTACCFPCIFHVAETGFLLYLHILFSNRINVHLCYLRRIANKQRENIDFQQDTGLQRQQSLSPLWYDEIISKPMVIKIPSTNITAVLLQGGFWPLLFSPRMLRVKLWYFKAGISDFRMIILIQEAKNNSKASNPFVKTAHTQNKYQKKQLLFLHKTNDSSRITWFSSWDIVSGKITAIKTSLWI